MSRIYEIDGVEYPSVTSLIGTLSKGDQLLTWASKQALDYVANNMGGGMPLEKIFENAKTNHLIVLDEAASIGSEIHALIEKNIKGQWFDYRTIQRPEVKKAFFGYLDWKKAHRVRFVTTEKTVVSKIHGFAGTLDTVLEFEGHLYVTDWKSSNSIYDTFGLQLSAYREALREMGLKTDGQIIVRLDKATGKSETKEFTQSHEKNLDAFLKLVDFWYSFKSRRLKGNPRANSAELKARLVA